MSLSNTATPIYYGQFRDAVVRGLVPVNREIAMEMNRIDSFIENPHYFYDDEAVEGWAQFCEEELTLTPVKVVAVPSPVTPVTAVTAVPELAPVVPETVTL